jgi:hypothetical protein
LPETFSFVFAMRTQQEWACSHATCSTYLTHGHSSVQGVVLHDIVSERVVLVTKLSRESLTEVADLVD